MLQPILTPEKLWPGGIPLSVRPHPADDLTDGPENWDFKDWTEECKGWCQFVEEEWVPKTDLNEEMQQRRSLIERWASADQAVRDSYQERAPARKSALDYPPHLLSKVNLGQDFFFCLAGVDKEHHADNYIRLVKNLILLYLHDNRSGGYHPLSHSSGREYGYIPELLADSSTTPDYINFFSHHDLLINLYLHSADFRAVSMTRSGTVVFPMEFSNEIYTVIDQDNLNQGRVAVMTFKPNGEIGEYANVFAWNLAQMMNFYYGLGWPCYRLFDSHDRSFTAPVFNKPVNMDEPLMTIVNSLIERRDLNTSGFQLEDWQDEIEKFAPGYLALESQGRAIEFDLADLWNADDQSYNHYTLEQKRRYQDTGSYFMPPTRFIPPPRQPVPVPSLPPPSHALGESFFQLFKDKLSDEASKK